MLFAIFSAAAASPSLLLENITHALPPKNNSTKITERGLGDPSWFEPDVEIETATGNDHFYALVYERLWDTMLPALEKVVAFVDLIFFRVLEHLLDISPAATTCILLDCMAAESVFAPGAILISTAVLAVFCGQTHEHSR